MKRLVAILCTAATVFTMAVSAMAAPSIGQFEFGDAKVDMEGTTATIPEGMTVAVQESNPDSYKSEKAKDFVKLANGDEPVTMEDLLKTVDLDIKEKVKTTDDKEVDLSEYDPITTTGDLVLTDGENVEYTSDGKIKATVKVEVAEDAKKENLLIMQVDPETGDVYFIEVDDFDPKTGEITAVFPILGPFIILEKTAE